VIFELPYLLLQFDDIFIYWFDFGLNLDFDVFEDEEDLILHDLPNELLLPVYVGSAKGCARAAEFPRHLSVAFKLYSVWIKTSTLSFLTKTEHLAGILAAIDLVEVSVVTVDHLLHVVLRHELLVIVG
jgi:hypothetical protein